MSYPSVARIGDITPLAAPGFLGCISNVFLFGILTVQAYLYYLSFPKDTRLVKGLVAAVFSAELIQTILVLYDGFRVYARHFTEVSALEDVGITWLSSPIMCGIVGCVVQIFFVYRIWILSRARLVCAFISLLSLLQCGAAIATGVLALEAKTFARIAVATRVPYTLWQVSAAVCDVTIAIALTIYLHTRKSIFKKTNVLISRLISMAIETGTVTATVAILEVVLFLAFPGQIYFTMPTYMIAKVYSNSFMAILNSRMRINGGRNEQRAEVAMSRSTLPMNGHIRSSSPPLIHVKTEIWTDGGGIMMGNLSPKHSSCDEGGKAAHATRSDDALQA